MSEIVSEGAGEETPAAETPVTQVTEVPVSEAKPQRVLKVYGREFDVSTDIGLVQAQTWSEAMSTLAGKQSTEIGTLRKFAKEHTPTGKEAELVAQAKELAASGETDRAIGMVFDYAKETEGRAKAAAERERHNSELWETYFGERPDLLKLFDKKTIRVVSETALNLKDDTVTDVFQTLDSFWKPKMSQETPPAPKAQDSEKPPVTLSGGSVPRSATPTTPKKPLSLDELLDSVSDTKRRAAKRV